MIPKQPVTHDFSWINQGKHLRPPSIEETDLLKPYTLKSHPNNQKALLMLHGYASTPGVFRHFYPYLAHYDFVFAPLLSGHGQSIQTFAQTSRHTWLSDIKSFLSDLCQTYSRVDVLGLSMGGLLAAYHIHDFPIHHLYLLAPAFDLTKPESLLLNTAEGMRALGFSSIANLGGKISNPHEAELTYRQLPLTSIIEVLKLIQDYNYKPWQTPTTLFLGERDSVVSSSKVAKKLESLPHLNIQFLKKANHVLPIDYEHQTIINTIVNHSKS